MGWQTAFATFTSLMAALAAWFLYDLVKEFKEFKKETKRDIKILESERESFKNTIRSSEVTIGARVNELVKVHNDFSLKIQSQVKDMDIEIHKAAASIANASEKLKSFDAFYGKCLLILKKFDEDIKSMKVQIKDLIIFKNGKT